LELCAQIVHRVKERAFIAGGVSGLDFILWVRRSGSQFAPGSAENGESISRPFPGQPDDSAITGAASDEDHLTDEVDG
jgi:hypothetical protein